MLSYQLYNLQVTVLQAAILLLAYVKTRLIFRPSLILDLRLHQQTRRTKTDSQTAERLWKSRLKSYIIIRWGQGCIYGGILVHEYVTTYWQLKKNSKGKIVLLNMLSRVLKTVKEDSAKARSKLPFSRTLLWSRV